MNAAQKRKLAAKKRKTAQNLLAKAVSTEKLGNAAEAAAFNAGADKFEAAADKLEGKPVPVTLPGQPTDGKPETWCAWIKDRAKVHIANVMVVTATLSVGEG